MNKRLSTCRFAFHLVVYTAYVCGWYHTTWMYMYVDVPHELNKNGGFWKTITNWNKVIQTVTITLSLFCDFFESNNRNILIRIRDSLFNDLALPLAVFISTGFWTLYAMDKDLVLREGMESLTPMPKNHLLHTLPIVFTLFDSVLVDHRRREERLGFILLLATMISFTSYAIFLGYFLDDWVYPYLRHMDHCLRIGFIFIHIALPTLYYYLSGLIYDILWPKDKKLSKQWIDNCLNSS